VRRGARRVRAGTVVALVVSGATTSGCSPEPGSRHHRLEIRAAAFQPASWTVAVGDTVSWTNHDLVPHTVTGRDGAWDSGELAPGERYTRVVAEEDVRAYLCRYHPAMTATLEVP